MKKQGFWFYSLSIFNIFDFYRDSKLNDFLSQYKFNIDMVKELNIAKIYPQDKLNLLNLYKNYQDEELDREIEQYIKKVKFPQIKFLIERMFWIQGATRQLLLRKATQTLRKEITELRKNLELSLKSDKNHQ